MVSNKIKSILFNGIIRTIHESFLYISVSALIGLKKLRLGHIYTWIENFNSAINIISLWLLAVFVASITILYEINLDDKKELD